MACRAKQPAKSYGAFQDLYNGLIKILIQPFCLPKAFNTPVSRRFTDYVGAESQESSPGSQPPRLRVSLFERLHIRPPSRRSKSRSGSESRDSSRSPFRGSRSSSKNRTQSLDAAPSVVQESLMPQSLAVGTPTLAPSKRQRSQDGRSLSDRPEHPAPSGSVAPGKNDEPVPSPTVRVPGYLNQSRLGMLDADFDALFSLFDFGGVCHRD